MIIESSLPNARTIFCDDIRHEINGKVTHVGIYTGEMTIYSNGPAVIPLLCLSLSYRDLGENLAKGPLLYKLIKSTEAGEEVLLEAPFTPPEDLQFIDPPMVGRSEGTNFIEMKLEGRLNGLVFQESCLLKSRMFMGDDVVLCGALRVIIHPADQQPQTVIG